MGVCDSIAGVADCSICRQCHCHGRNLSHDPGDRRKKYALLFPSVSDIGLSWYSFRRMSNQVAIQGIVYSGSLIIVLLPTATTNIVWTITGLWNDIVGGIVLVLTSLQGLLYMFIFFRTRQQPKTAYGWYADTIVKSVCCARYLAEGPSGRINKALRNQRPGRHQRQPNAETAKTSSIPEAYSSSDDDGLHPRMQLVKRAAKKEERTKGHVRKKKRRTLMARREYIVRGFPFVWKWSFFDARLSASWYSAGFHRRVYTSACRNFSFCKTAYALEAFKWWDET